MTKMNPNNRNETKSDIFLWYIFKFEAMSFFVKKYQSISITLKIGNFTVLWLK